MSAPGFAAAPKRVTALGALVRSLTARGAWADATVPDDPYAAAADARHLQPVMPPRSGHTPARLSIHGNTVALSTFDRKGHATEQVVWSWVDPVNLQRVHDYVTAALQDALEMRGER